MRALRHRVRGLARLLVPASLRPTVRRALAGAEVVSRESLHRLRRESPAERIVRQAIDAGRSST